jgi:O-acetyl-ADP-ribose deacetylase (regulator of RNase III)
MSIARSLEGSGEEYGNMALQIEVVQSSILEVTVEAIVNAANSLGIMGGGVAGVIKRAAGSSVEEEARRHAPIPVGQAIVTSGGLTRFKAIIHAPTMSRPAMRIPPENVALATRGALTAADTAKIASLAIPGMGTGVGGVLCSDAAALMIRELRAFQARALRSVVLVDVDQEMVEAWRRCLKAKESVKREK